jgi:hypothetical protein
MDEAEIKRLLENMTRDELDCVERVVRQLIEKLPPRVPPPKTPARQQKPVNRLNPIYLESQLKRGQPKGD